MPDYDTLKQELARISEDTTRLLDDARSTIQQDDEGLSGWRTTCRTIAAQIDEDIMRVAVVGAIKSGKSTFVNMLFGGDYLKRGAGVVTSIVTRVRSGEQLKASLFLKSWDTVNQEVNRAAILLPTSQSTDENNGYDLRRDRDRQVLEHALAQLAADQLISNDTRSAGSVLLSACLAGYERVADQVQEAPATVVYEGARFPRHRDFVGDDTMAVYLEDVLLEIDRTALGAGVEVADCQGSDSPNPMHLAMIQDYLAIAHLTIYVISSRTGLRQADIRFLSMIRSMGILDNVVFVINCDLSEHESLPALQEGVARIAKELSLLCPEPRIFAISSLYLLMSRTEGELSNRDAERFVYWRRETGMVDFTLAEAARLQELLRHKIDRERHALLIKNHLERLEIVVSGIGSWIGFHRDFLARDAGGAKTLVDRLQDQRGRLDRLKRTVAHTLDGSVNQIKGDLKQALDHFFEAQSDGVVTLVLQFVHGYAADMSHYATHLTTAGFARTLYLVFQEFKQSVDTHMAETVNPQVIRFVREQEKHLMAYMDEIAGPFGAMIDEALDQYAAAMDDVNMTRRQTSAPIHIGSSLEAIRNTSGLSLPTALATMHYSTQIKTEAVMRLGFYKIVNLVRKVFKRPAESARQETVLALTAGIRRMKRETERSIRFHLKDYRENIKYQYLMKLVDAVADTLQRRMVERFRHHGADLSRLAQLISEQRIDKENLTASLDRMEELSRVLEARIVQLKTEFSRLYPESGAELPD